MKKLITLLLILSISLFAIEQKQEGVGWLDIFAYDENSKKPRVLLIGDSIISQYAHKIREVLSNKSITRFSTSKSICAKYYINQLSIAMTQPYEIILINNGLHDFYSTNTQYEKCYKKTLDYSRKTNPNSTIMLVSTTPVKGIKERNDIVVQRNQSLKKLSKTFNLPYIDLYSLLKDKYELYRDAYHHTEEG